MSIQPVMVMTVLRHDGECSTRIIAESILANDESQIEYLRRRRDSGRGYPDCEEGKEDDEKPLGEPAPRCSPGSGMKPAVKHRYEST